MTAHHGIRGEISNLRWLVDNWWLVLLRGIVAILFGVLTFIWPGITVLSLTLLWGAYALVDGVVAIWTAISSKATESSKRWWLALAGVVGVLAGILTMVVPLATALGLLLFLATWLIIAGVLQIVGAIQLRAEIDNEWLLGLTGLLSILLGISLVLFPGSGLLSVSWLIGAFAIAMGVSYIGLAMRLRKVASHA
jgi:uncharacterized membrane protein HdeD (DUF308 family)